MKKLLTVFGAAVILAGGMFLPAGAEDVGVTVSVQVISLGISDGGVDYGILDAGETADTIDDTQTVTNNSNVGVDISLRSSDAEDSAPGAGGGDIDWDLVSCVAAASATDDYGHQYEINDTNATFSGTDFPATGTFDNTFTATVIAIDENGGTTFTFDLDLRICMPSILNDTSDHDIIVTVLATET